MQVERAYRLDNPVGNHSCQRQLGAGCLAKTWATRSPGYPPTAAGQGVINVGWPQALGPGATGEINRTSPGRLRPAFTIGAKHQVGLNL